MALNISRRQVIGGVIASGAASALGLPTLALGSVQGPTPALTLTEQQAIDSALGKKGTYNDGQATHVVAFPRNDLHVTIKGQSAPIPLGFGGWAAFKRTLDGKSAIFMSDNVLLEEEINPLIDAAHSNGLMIGAIHNHFLFENPRVFFMHVHGMGEPGDLASRYAKAIADSKISPKNQPPATRSAVIAADIFDLSDLDRIVGAKGTANGAAYKFAIGRKDLKIIEMTAEMTAAIGLNTWCTFVGTADEATVAGDVAMLAHEVNPVIALLRKAGFEVCALHSHMLTEQPRILFMHYLGHGKSQELAKTFRSVLDILGNVPGDMTMGK